MTVEPLENMSVILRWPRAIRLRGDSFMIAIPPEFLAANDLKANSPIELELLGDKTLRIVPGRKND